MKGAENNTLILKVVSSGFQGRNSAVITINHS